ncbi:MAG: hypothetical protein DRP59_01410 [Spirochaetes bacterium]|nr:MAG: hypothetical protein DRP59_01410 [Spirochaetota bacterium]
MLVSNHIAGYFVFASDNSAERVANHAVEMAEALDLGEKALQEIRIGALLHDIGKLGVPGETD